jgi:hypothetical protein
MQIDNFSVGSINGMSKESWAVLKAGEKINFGMTVKSGSKDVATTWPKLFVPTKFQV